MAETDTVDILSSQAGAPTMPPPPKFTLLERCMAEMLGTFLFVTIGIGSVSAGVITGAQVGLWQVAVVWGFGLTLGIYSVCHVSGGHLNPAVSLCFALLRRKSFSWKEFGCYTAAQLAGGMLAGVANISVFNASIQLFEADHHLVRGEPGSEWSAMVFGAYFPNPAIFGQGKHYDMINFPGAMAIEAFGAAILVFMIFSLTDKRSSALGPDRMMAPYFIGFTVGVLISLYAPLTQGAFNPARDFGPRLIALMAGWGKIAIPGPRGGFFVYIIGPFLGAPLGGIVYDMLIGRTLTKHEAGKADRAARAAEEAQAQQSS